MSNKLSIKDGMTELGVTTYDGEKAIVSSRKVADVFTKRHRNVLRDIDNLIDKASDKFTKLNFERSEYKDASGKSNREYLLTKDGCVMLVMSYTGEKAMKFKEAYIEQFNRMKKLIKERNLTKIEYKPMTDAIKAYRERQGKEPKFYHFTNEADMINRIVLGDTSKKYCEEQGIDQEKLRDHLPEWKLKAIKKLQRLNTELLRSELEYDQRKSILQANYNNLYRNLKITE